MTISVTIPQHNAEYYLLISSDSQSLYEIYIICFIEEEIGPGIFE